MRARCRDGQRLHCRPVLHPSFAAGWLGARDGRGGIIVQAGRQAQAASSKRRMVGAMAHTNRQIDRRLVGNVVQVVAEPRRRKVIIVHAKGLAGSQALSGQAAKQRAKALGARAWVLACCAAGSLSVVHRWLRVRGSCGEARVF